MNEMCHLSCALERLQSILMPLIVISRREQIDMQRVATDVHRKANNHEPRRADSSYGLFQYIPELVQCVCMRCVY